MKRQDSLLGTDRDIPILEETTEEETKRAEKEEKKKAKKEEKKKKAAKKAVRDLRKNPTQATVRVLDLTKIETPAGLAEWLVEEIGDRVQELAEAFVFHEIGAVSFRSITEDHLQEMLPESTIGLRMSVIHARQKVTKQLRVTNRNKVIARGKCLLKVKDGIPKPATYELTNAALKLKLYTDVTNTKLKKPAPQDKPGRKGYASLERTVTTVKTVLQTIDLSAIEDVDCEDQVRVVNSTKVEFGYRFSWMPSCLCFPCCVWKPFWSCCKTVNTSREEVSEACLQLSLNLGESALQAKGEGASNFVELLLDDTSSAHQLQKYINDAVEEVQEAERR